MSAEEAANSASPAPGIACALVIGASGYVGRAVGAELRRKGIATIAHVRADSARLEHWREQSKTLGAELATTAWELGAFSQLIRDRAVSHVFLCLGTTLRRRLRGSKSSVPDNYESVDFGLSVLVIDACVKSARQPRVVLLSSAGARAESRSNYLSARGRIESYLQASGLEFTIARPGIITGPGRDEFRLFERVAGAAVDWSLLWGAVLGMQILRERYRSIGAEELAKALVSHAIDPDSRGKVLPGEKLRDFP